MNAGAAGRLGTALLALAVAAAHGAPSSDTPLRADLQRLLAQQQLAGAVVAVVDGERTTLAAVGHAHAPTQAPLDVQARVHVGSVAKTLLSLAVLRLVTQGRVALDTPLQALLPELPVHNPWAASHTLRLRHLLDHTGGLEDMRLWHLFNRRHDPRMPLADGLRQPGLLHLRTPPGKRASYSNIGYLIVGLVIERLTGEPYEDWGRRELLQPLGMAHSSFAFTTQVGSAADPALAWGHLDGLRPRAAIAIAARPGAQFTTTAADMARLARFLMGDGRLGGQVFVAGDLLRGMGRPQGTDAARAGLTAGYALGLATRDRHGAAGLCHEGSIVGFRALLCLFPPAQRAFFIAFNSDSETADHSLFYARLTQSLGLGGPLPASAAADAAPDAADTHSGRYVAAPSRFPRFALLDLLFSTRVLDLGTLPARWTRAGAVALLYPAGPGLWRQPDRLHASLVLLDDGAGTPTVSDGFSSYERVTPLRWLGAWSSVGLGAAGLGWWLTAPLWRRWRAGTSLLQPAWLAVLALPLAGALMAVQGWPALGEFTAASALLWLATAALPLAMAWQAGRAGRMLRRQPRRGLVDLAAALAVLQASLLLAAAGLLPLALWR